MSQPRDDRQDDLFRPALEKIIDLRHPLVRLAGTMIGIFWRGASARHVGWSRGRTPLVAGLFILKHMHNLSDEELCDRWVENRYFQGGVPPRGALRSFVVDRWRQRLGEEHITALLQDFRWRIAPVRSRSKISSGLP